MTIAISSGNIFSKDVHSAGIQIQMVDNCYRRYCYSNGNVTLTQNLSVGGDLDVTGTLDLSDSDFTNVGSIQLDSIAGDGDTNTSITFFGSDVITIATGGSNLPATFNANQILTLSDDLIIKDVGTIGSASDPDAIR